MARARKLVDRILAVEDKIVLVPHENADVDAVASAYGLFLYLSSKGKSASLVFPSISAQAKALLEKMEMDYGTEMEKGFVVGVDVSSEDMMPTGVHADFFFDHHASSKLSVKAPSCSELVAELLLEEGIRHDTAYAMLACGIITDTAGLTMALPETLRVLADLLETLGMKVSDIQDLMEEKTDISERIAKLKALERAKVYRYSDFLLVVTKVKAFEGSAAGVAVSAGADMAFVVGNKRVIGRARNSFYKETGVNVLDVFKELGVECGGHELAAGTHQEVPPEAIPEAFEKLLSRKGYKSVLKEY